MPELDVHRIFDRVASVYDTAWLQRALYAALQDQALAELRAQQPGSVLDVGCGTGIFAARLEREFIRGAVFGCDISAGMLAEAAGRGRSVGWVRADSARLPVRTAGVDAVVSTQAFHFFDQPAAWAEFRRVLAPGGYALVGMINPETPAGSQRLSRLATRVARTRMHWPTGAEIRRLAVDAGFEVTAQRRVAWRFDRIAPLLLTVGRYL